MDPITLALGAVIGSPVISGAVAYIVAHKKSQGNDEEETEPVKNKAEGFECPYCHNWVTGFQELDLIHHVACIGKSKEDLEAEAKKPKTPKDEYYVKFTRYETDFNGQYNSRQSWGRVANNREAYERFTWQLFRNGEEIDSGSHTTEEAARFTAKQAQDLDEHKRRTKKKRV